MIDQENSSAWGQEGFESAAPLAYNYPLSPKLGLFTRLWEQPSHCRAGASLGRIPPCGASMLGETACGYVGFCYCQSSALGWGLCACARFVLSGVYRVGASVRALLPRRHRSLCV